MGVYEFYGCDTVALAKEYGTPLYVMSEDAILSKIGELKAAFDNKYKGARTSYASKAFLTKDMIRIIMREGIGLDVVSGGELYAAQELGFPMEGVTFHGNSKTVAEIEQGLAAGVGHFVCDSIGEIFQIEESARAGGKHASILIRVTPGVDSHTHKHIQTGMADSKFGVPLSKMTEAIEICMKLKNVELDGFHFHIGSQILENTSHLMAVEVVLKLIKKAHDELGFVTKEFDLGGGFGIYYQKTDVVPHISEFLDPMVEKIQSFCSENNLQVPNLSIEPGRFVVGAAGITLYTVGSVKEIPGIRKYVGVDGGMPDNPRPSLYQAVYEAEVCNKFGDEKTETVTIAGKCCESGDILIKDLPAPKIEQGDILAVKSTGAYHYSMASNYNKLPIPAVVMIKDGVPRISVRRQSNAEMYQRDI